MSDQLPPLPSSATLSEWQKYLTDTVAARGWNRASDLEIFLLFSEEVGEFAKALRRHRKLFSERTGGENGAKTQPADLEPSRREMAEELADVFSYLLDLAGRLEIDLEQAFVEKERRNRQRDWEAPPDESQSS